MDMVMGKKYEMGRNVLHSLEKLCILSSLKVNVVESFLGENAKLLWKNSKALEYIIFLFYLVFFTYLAAYIVKCNPIWSTGNLDLIIWKSVYVDQGDPTQFCFEKRAQN